MKTTEQDVRRVTAGDVGVSYCSVCSIDLAGDANVTAIAGYQRIQYVCDDCLDRYYRQCSDCGGYFSSSNRQELNGQMYCLQCASQVPVTCSDCGDTIPYSESQRTADGQIVCQSCSDSDYSSCDGCSRLFHNDDIYYSSYGERVYCADCHSEYFTECDNCGGTIHRNDSYEYRGDYYCYSCYNERRDNETIHSYDYKPEPIFLGEQSDDGKTLYTGSEIECEAPCGYDVDEIAEDFGHFDELYLKHDGSLDDGFEVVTHPMTLEYARRFMPNRLRELANLGMRSHDTSTCGLHVHINRSFLSDTEQHRLGYFVLIQQDKIKLLARRGNVGYSKYKDIDGTYNNDSIKYNSDRYEALNWQNDYTIEFRMFRGTLNVKTYIATLEFVDSVARFVKTVHTEDIRNTAKCWKLYREFIAGKAEYKTIADKLTGYGF